MPKRRTDEEIIVSATNAATRMGYTFSKIVSRENRSPVKIEVVCKKHGPWITTTNNFVCHGKGCRRCYGTAYVPPEIRKGQLESLAKLDGYSFLRFEGEYTSSTSTAIFGCEDHGEWATSINSFVSRGVRCQKCSADRVAASHTLSPYDVAVLISKAVSGDKYWLMSIGEDYENIQSYVTMGCKEHGEWRAKVAKILHGGTRCQKCKRNGFQVGKRGTLYVLRSECGIFMKIGISNVMRRRMSELRKETPFPFSKIEEYCGDGSTGAAMERWLHKQFESAAFSGFDGATEWFKWDSGVSARIECFAAGAQP